MANRTFRETAKGRAQALPAVPANQRAAKTVMPAVKVVAPKASFLDTLLGRKGDDAKRISEKDDVKGHPEVDIKRKR